MNKVSEVPQQNDLLDEIAGRLFELLPEEGLSVILMNRDGRCFSNNDELLLEVLQDKHRLEQIAAAVDDGDDPAIVSIGDYDAAASQLTAGYVFLFLKASSSESVSTDMPVIEILLRQTVVIAEMIYSGYQKTAADVVSYSSCGYSACLN
jgi:hypothetical protein